MERFAYNPENKVFIDCHYSSHSVALYNKGQQKDFDKFIRGIYAEGVLYLRLYYPLPDIDILSLDVIEKRSRGLLNENLYDILDIIKKEYDITPVKIVLNAVNDLLVGKGFSV